MPIWAVPLTQQCKKIKHGKSGTQSHKSHCIWMKITVNFKPTNFCKKYSFAEFTVITVKCIMILLFGETIFLENDILKSV